MFSTQFVDRYFKISEVIADALVSLGVDLRRIATYDRLFGESRLLEDILCQSYVDILHFWNHVYQELHRPSKPHAFSPSSACAHAKHSGATKIISALVPLRSAKLDKIIQRMRSNAECVERQAQVAKEERAQYKESGKYGYLNLLRPHSISYN